jgi:hypothetical protein
MNDRDQRIADLEVSLARCVHVIDVQPNNVAMYVQIRAITEELAMMRATPMRAEDRSQFAFPTNTEINTGRKL